MRVYSPAFEYIYRITKYQKLQIVKRYVGNSVMTLGLLPEDIAAHFLHRNSFIVDSDGEPFVVKHIVQGLEEITITAYGCHKLLEQRVTGAGAKKNVTISRTGSADDVVKHFIDQCKGDLPIRTAAVQGGASISDQTRLKILGDEVVRILSGTGRGERFALDDDEIVFDTYLGTDRSRRNASDNPPVVFDLKYKNIADQTYTESSVDEQTAIYVGGAGEGDEREIVVVGGDKTGLDRVERFRDARDVEKGDTAKLTERGNQAIVSTLATVATTAVADSGLVYGEDYFLGDVVTTRIIRKTYAHDGEYFNPIEETIEVNQRITEVVITHEAGAEDIDLRFGDEPITPTQLQSVRQDVAQLKAAESAPPYRPNLLINGDFKVWQRGTSFIDPSMHYTADRWRLLSSAPGITVTKDVNGMKITRTGWISCYVYYYFEEEDYQRIKDKSLTLSMSANGVVTSQLVEIDIYLRIGFWAPFNGNEVVLNWVKLEIGDTATPFVPRTYAEELALCQRYYYQITGNTGAFHGTGLGDSGMAIIPIDTPTPMRTLPTLINPFPSTMRVRVGGSNYTPSSFIGVDDVEGSRVVIKYGGSFPAGYWACAFYTSGAPVMAFDAEIY